MFLNGFIRGLPDFKGKRRLMRFLTKSEIEKSSDTVISGRYGCKYLLPNIKESVAFEIFCNGIYEADTNEFLYSHLPANGVFLDLGANIGSVTIPLLKRRPDLKCICVEAAPWIFDYLRKNRDINFSDEAITLINKALMDRDGELLPFYSPKEKFGKGSLSPVFTDVGTPVASITVDTIVKDFKLSTVDTIKIDIEGFEYFAFKGAEKLLSSPNAPDILFEFVDWAEMKAGLETGHAQRYLIEKGYQLYIPVKGQLKSCEKVVTKGTEMLFATKKQSKFATR
jgi:FkbM family methyltransferase